MDDDIECFNICNVCGSLININEDDFFYIKVLDYYYCSICYDKYDDFTDSE